MIETSAAKLFNSIDIITEVPPLSIKVLDINFYYDVLLDGVDIVGSAYNAIEKLLYENFLKEDFNLTICLKRRPIVTLGHTYDTRSDQEAALCFLHGFLIFNDELDYSQYQIAGKEIPILDTHEFYPGSDWHTELNGRFYASQKI